MRHNPALRDGHQIRLIEGGQDYFEALVAAIDQARSHVLLETYIFDLHGAAVRVAEGLERAALRGGGERDVSHSAPAGRPRHRGCRR